MHRIFFLGGCVIYDLMTCICFNLFKLFDKSKLYKKFSNLPANLKGFQKHDKNPFEAAYIKARNECLKLYYI